MMIINKNSCSICKTTSRSDDGWSSEQIRLCKYHHEDIPGWWMHVESSGSPLFPLHQLLIIPICCGSLALSLPSARCQKFPHPSLIGKDWGLDVASHQSNWSCILCVYFCPNWHTSSLIRIIIFISFLSFFLHRPVKMNQNQLNPRELDAILTSSSSCTSKGCNKKCMHCSLAARTWSSLSSSSYFSSSSSLRLATLDFCLRSPLWLSFLWQRNEWEFRVNSAATLRCNVNSVESAISLDGRNLYSNGFNNLTNVFK